MNLKKTTTLLAASAAILSSPAIADHHLESDSKQAAEFATTTIDIGCVVSDIEKSVEFYTEAIGFTEVTGFSVPADFAKQAGLTDSKQLDIRVLVLGEGEGATKLKLMQIKGGGNKKPGPQTHRLDARPELHHDHRQEQRRRPSAPRESRRQTDRQRPPRCLSRSIPRSHSPSSATRTATSSNSSGRSRANRS